MLSINYVCIYIYNRPVQIAMNNKKETSIPPIWNLNSQNIIELLLANKDIFSFMKCL